MQPFRPPVLRVFGAYRDAFGGLPRLTWLLCLTAFLNRCGAMVVPFLGLYAKERFGYSAEDAGLLLSIYGVGSVAGSYLGGVLCDRIGSVRIQVLALLGSGCWMFAMTQVLQPGWLEATTFVLALLNEAFRPGSITAVTASCEPALRRKALSLNRLMLNLGWAVGPTIGGYLVQRDFAVMFWVDGGTCLLAGAFLLFGLGGFSPRAEPRPADQGAARPLRDPHFRWLMLANLVVMLAFMQYFTTGSRIFEDRGYLRSEIGWFLAINPILIVMFEMVTIHALRRRTALPIIAIGSLVVGLGYLTLLLPLGGYGIALAMAIVAGGELLQMPLLGAYVNDYAPAHARGAYNGAYGMVFSSALILAPLFGGTMYERAGENALWLACGGLGAVGAIMFLRAPPPTRPQSESSP
ncbi:MAG: MFS transporter [Planctomycetota bacterium]